MTKLLVYNYETEDGVLCHHGVKGMKWGEHRFKTKQAEYAARVKKYRNKAESSKFGITKRSNMMKATRYQNKMDIEKAAHDSKGLAKKYQARYGDKAKEIINSNASKTYSQMKDTYKSDKSKRRADALSANANYKSQYYKKAQTKNFGERMVKSLIFDTDVWNMPYQRVSGRTTTVGKQFIDGMLTAGIGGKIKDNKYRRAQKKQ